MSLPEFSTQSSLFSTAVLSGNLFAEDDRYRIFARIIFPRLAAARPELEGCYCADNGRVAIEPVLMAGTSVLQFVDGMPDRAAVEMLKYHAGWNFALNRQLGDPAFHHSSLSNFRQRMIERGKSSLVFETVLDGLVEAGLISRRRRQRLDSTQVFANVSRMSRLECVRETLRLGMEELAENHPALPHPEFWTTLWERYVENKLDYRADASVLEQKMTQAGLDVRVLLDWLGKLDNKEPSQGEQIQLLQRVWQENFKFEDDGKMRQLPAQPAGAVANPHDPEAQWAAKGHGKRKKEHVGYKVQVAETIHEGTLEKAEPTPNFITAMATQPAIASDDAGLPLVEEEQQAMGLDKPKELYVDGAYVSAERLVQAKAEGREIIGPAQASPRREGCFSVDEFQVHVEERKAICPAGKESTQCSRLEEEKTGKVHYRIEWSTHCHNCPLRDRCVGKGQTHRTIWVGEHHTALQDRRQEQQTDEFKEKVRRRNAIEGTQSELVRGHGLRRARYRGLAKTRLQNYFIGAACNIKRWIRREVWLMKQAARHVSGAATIAAVS